MNNTPARFRCLSIVLALAATAIGYGQGMPTSQPKMLTIVRESVKVGHAEDHSRHEAGWPAAYEKAQSPDYYLAMISMTGTPEAWYVVPVESNAAFAATMKREDKDPVLSAELSRLAARDAEYISNVSVLQAVARPDLTVGAFPNLAKTRFYEITLYRVRPGQSAKFDALVRAYNESRKRVAPDSAYRVYSVTAGMPGPAYLVFSAVDDYAKFDQTMADHNAAIAKANPAEKAELDKLGEIILSSETNRFRLDPKQSYVAKETRATDPEFWSGK